MSKYLDDLAMRAAEAMWAEWNVPEVDEGPWKATFEDVKELAKHEIYADMEELFDMIWLDITESENGSIEAMPRSYAICKELAHLIPDHIEIMYELDTDLNPIE